MKKTFIKTIIILILIISVLSLSSCGDKYKLKQEEGYFETEHYICIENDEAEVTIVGLTKKGMKLEELAFPTEIEGKPVLKIGGLSRNYDNYFVEGAYKKVFFPEGVRIGRTDLFLGKDIKVILVKIPEGLKILPNDALGIGQRYAPATFCENEEIIDYSYIAPANVSFMNNYDNSINGGYHWIDDVEEGEKIKTIPIEPVREGYTFAGWYTEIECINKWTFDSIAIDGDRQSLDLYAKWI